MYAPDVGVIALSSQQQLRTSVAALVRQMCRLLAMLADFEFLIVRCDERINFPGQNNIFAIE